MCDSCCILDGVFVCFVGLFVFFFKQKTAYEMRISDWSSDVCSSDLRAQPHIARIVIEALMPILLYLDRRQVERRGDDGHPRRANDTRNRSRNGEDESIGLGDQRDRKSVV